MRQTEEKIGKRSESMKSYHHVETYMVKKRKLMDKRSDENCRRHRGKVNGDKSPSLQMLRKVAE